MRDRLLLIATFLLLTLLACTEPAAPPTATIANPIVTVPSADTGGDGYPESGYPTGQTAAIDRNTTWPLFAGDMLFHSGRLGDISLFKMSGATGEYTRLPVGRNAFEPEYSPDCSQIIYTGTLDNGRFGLFVSDADGNNSRAVVQSDAGGDAYGATWSADGSQIAYMLLENARIDVCVANPDGSAERCMAQPGMNNANPAFSADGNMLIFTSNRDGDWEVFSTPTSDLSANRQLTNNTYNDLRPRVSSADRIVYDASPTGQYDIYTMNLDGGDVRQITTDSTDDTAADWLNDQILFTSLRSLEGDIYLINSDGTNLTRLTNDLGSDSEPTYCAP